MISSATGTEAVVILGKSSVSSLREYSTSLHTKGDTRLEMTGSVQQLAKNPPTCHEKLNRKMALLSTRMSAQNWGVLTRQH